MTLLEIVADLKETNPEDTIYASQPWTPGSTAIIAAQPEDGSHPKEAKDYDYFLEVFIAKDFIEDWRATQGSDTASILSCCERLIQYAINDA